MLVFVEGGKPENPEKNPRSKVRTNNKLNLHMTLGRNRTQATLASALTTAPFLLARDSVVLKSAVSNLGDQSGMTNSTFYSCSSLLLIKYIWMEMCQAKYVLVVIGFMMVLL